MKKSFASTVILSLIFAGLLAWYLVYEKKIKPKNTESEESAKRLVSLDKSDIQELTVTRMKNAPKEEGGADPKTPEFETIKLKKTGEDWHLLEPVQDAADNSSVTQMISELTSIKQDRVVDEKPQSLEPFGLKDPVLKISARKDASAPAEEVLVGKNTPVGYSSYAQATSQGPSIYRISRSLRTSFDKDAKAIRNKNIVMVSRFDVAELEIQNARENILLKKDDKDHWMLTRDHLPADANEVNKSLNAIVDAKADDFVSEDGKRLEEFGLKSPAAKVWLIKKDKSKIGLWIGKLKDKVFAKREDKATIYQIGADELAMLDRPSADYRNLQLAQFNRFDVRRVKLERGKEVVELLKEGSDWSMPTEPQVKIDPIKVDNLLTSIQDTKISKYLLNNKEGATVNQPELVLRLFEKKDAGETEKVTLKFGSRKANLISVEQAGLGVPILIKQEDFKKMNLSKQDFIKVEEKPESKKEPEKKS